MGFLPRHRSHKTLLSRSNAPGRSPPPGSATLRRPFDRDSSRCSFWAEWS